MWRSYYDKLSSWNRIFFFSILVVFLAQININLVVTDFKISIGIFLFPVLLFLLDDFPIIPVTFLSSIGVFLSRVLLSCLQSGFYIDILRNSFPEVLFYLTYGCLLYFYYRYKNHILDKNRCFIPLIVMDYCANFIELLYRMHLNVFSFNAQFSILIAAIIRTVLIWSIVTAIDSYGFALINKEHAERYKKLLFLISRLKGEVIWMQKNTALIEHTMNDSYNLFNRMKNSDVDESLSRTALGIAKDIHEIKKEYMLIMRGISEALNDDLRDTGMYVSEIFSILQDVHIREAKANKKNLIMDIQCDEKLYTNKPYYLMSIFNNLFTNALEASPTENIKIIVREDLADNTYIFSVTDFGKGISSDNVNDIFSPGFSTKINYSTGEINRGLGLSLVKDIVEIEFKGKVTFESKENQTTFYVKLSKRDLEGTANEIISY